MKTAKLPSEFPKPYTAGELADIEEEARKRGWDAAWRDGYRSGAEDVIRIVREKTGVKPC